jgi:arylsulfatase A-like enzyme
MKSLGIRLACVVGIGASALGSTAFQDNVCIIVVDDAGPELFDAFDRYQQSVGLPSGSPARTPAVDELLVARGVMFANAWACPNCSPTRAAIMTGRMPSKNGVGTITSARPVTDNPGLEMSMPILPQFLRGAPEVWARAAVGKWHLADSPQILANPTHPLGSPPGQWFERFAGTYFQASPLEGYPGTQFGHSAWTKSFATVIQLAVNPCAPGTPPCTVQMIAPPVANYTSVDTTDDALALIAELPRPYFLYVAYNAVHMPLANPPPGLPSSGCGPVPPWNGSCSYPGLTPTQQRGRCMLEALDSQIARLMCAIDPDDTHVFFLGDNGSGDHLVAPPYSPAHGKGSVYEGGVHVPLIITSPRLGPSARGTVSRGLVHCTDLLATVCEIARVPLAPSHLIDSVSMVPYFDGVPSVTTLRSTLFTEAFVPNFLPDPVSADPPPGYYCRKHDQAIRDLRYKLIRIWRRDPLNGNPVATEKFFDLLAGATPPGGHESPRPDFDESHDLLASGQPLELDAQAALALFRYELDSQHPTLIH